MNCITSLASVSNLPFISILWRIAIVYKIHQIVDFLITQVSLSFIDVGHGDTHKPVPDFFESPA